MALLTRSIFVPSAEELTVLQRIKGPARLLLEPAVFGNAPQNCHIVDREGRLYCIQSDARDVVFAFEAIFLRLCQDGRPSADATEVVVDGEELGLLFSTEWLSSGNDPNGVCDWHAASTGTQAVETPFENLTGYLAWSGIAFGPDGKHGLLHLDDFPLGLRFTRNLEEIAERIQRGRLIAVDAAIAWIRSLRGWSTR